MNKLFAAVLTIAIVMTLSSCLNPPVLELTETPSATPIETSTDTPAPTELPTDTPTPDITPEPTVAPAPVLQTLASGTVLYQVRGGSGSFDFDLNRDGTPDTIEYTFYGTTGPVPDGAIDLTTNIMLAYNFDIYQCNLSINGQPIIIQGETMAGLIMICDIDTTDNQYEIMIPEYGPSDDPRTTFIAYHGVAPLNIGKENQTPMGNLKVDGSGIITGSKRGQKLHTWFYDATYTLYAGLIVEVKLDGNMVRMDSPVTALVDLPLQVSPTDASPAYTLMAGAAAVITLTDDERWFCVKNTSGQIGWFELTGFYTINGMPATDVFDGLCMAD